MAVRDLEDFKRQALTPRQILTRELLDIERRIRAGNGAALIRRAEKLRKRLDALSHQAGDSYHNS